MNREQYLMVPRQYAMSILPSHLAPQWRVRTWDSLWAEMEAMEPEVAVLRLADLLKGRRLASQFWEWKREQKISWLRENVAL